MMKPIRNLLELKVFSKKDKNPWIKFHTKDELLNSYNNPAPSVKFTPEWYKKLKPMGEGQPIDTAGTAKRCVPIKDALSQGFIIPLWSDLLVTVKQGYSIITVDGKKVEDLTVPYNESAIGQPWKENGLRIKHFVKSNELIIQATLAESTNDPSQPRIEGHSWEQVGEYCDLKKFKFGKSIMKFTNPWIVSTPKGYSAYFKNPSNNWSTDIELIEGVVDTDEFYTAVNFPFVWKGSEIGEFVIPKGTPLVQVIPFKRESYKIELDLYDDIKASIVQRKLGTKFHDRYKSMFWHKRKK